MKRVLVAIIFAIFLNSSALAKTVDYNDPNVSKEVNSLRKFRDFHLKKHAAGRAFIKYYYRYGPIAAGAIKGRERLKSLVRLCLLPLMYAGKNFNGVLVILMLLLLFIAGILVLRLYKKIKNAPFENKKILIQYH